jgi:hypothetical protein
MNSNMTATDRTKLMISLEKLISDWLTDGEGSGEDTNRPFVGENTAYYMAKSAGFILFAIDDQNQYLEDEGMLKE